MSDHSKPLKLEFASRESLLFVERLPSLFLARVLESPEALVTDESRISDFRDLLSYEQEEALREGTRPGYFIFKKRKFLRGGAPHRSFEETKALLAALPDEEIEAIPSTFKRDVIRKTKEVFGVDLSSVFDLSFPEVLHFILVQMPRDKRDEFSSLFLE